MISSILIPKLGANIDTATITQWLVKESAHIQKGTPLVEIDTAKAAFTIDSEEEGYLIKIIKKDSDFVDVDEVIALIASRKDEEYNEYLSNLKKEKEKKLALATFSSSPSAQQISQSIMKGTTSDFRLSPQARKFIMDNKINLKNYFSQPPEKVLSLEDVYKFFKSQSIVIYGAGQGGSIQAMDILSRLPQYKIEGFVDDNNKLAGKEISGFKVLGNLQDLKNLHTENQNLGVLISLHTDARINVYNKIKKEIPDISIISLIDPSATICSNVVIGESVFIEPGSVIGPNVIIGNNVIVDLGCTIAHDSTIKDHVHLAPGVKLGGGVIIERGALMGVGSSAASRVVVGEGAMVTPGTGLDCNVSAHTIVGNQGVTVLGKSKRLENAKS